MSSILRTRQVTQKNGWDMQDLKIYGELTSPNAHEVQGLLSPKSPLENPSPRPPPASSSPTPPTPPSRVSSLSSIAGIGTPPRTSSPFVSLPPPPSGGDVELGLMSPSSSHSTPSSHQSLGSHVTVSIKHLISSDRQAQYIQWQEGIMTANAKFPGFLGGILLKESYVPPVHCPSSFNASLSPPSSRPLSQSSSPPQQSTSPTGGAAAEASSSSFFLFVVILRFDSMASASCWNLSEERTLWLSLGASIFESSLRSLEESSPNASPGESTFEEKSFSERGEVTFALGELPLFEDLLTANKRGQGGGFDEGARSLMGEGERGVTSETEKRKEQEVRAAKGVKALIGRLKFWSLIWLQVFVLVEFFNVWFLPTFLPQFFTNLGMHSQICLSTLMSTLTIEFVTFRPLVWICKKIHYL